MKHLLILFLLIPSAIMAQVAKDSDLFLALKKMDQMVFDQGFNHCDLKILDAVTATDLEFFHDQGGIQNKEAFLKATRNNICGDATIRITRELVNQSLEVFPLYENNTLYGAVQKGEHLFYRKEGQNQTELTGYAKFTSLWILEEDEWQLKRVLSYDHQAR